MKNVENEFCKKHISIRNHIKEYFFHFQKFKIFRCISQNFCLKNTKKSEKITPKIQPFSHPNLKMAPGKTSCEIFIYRKAAKQLKHILQMIKQKNQNSIFTPKGCLRGPPQADTLQGRNSIFSTPPFHHLQEYLIVLLKISYD